MYLGLDLGTSGVKALLIDARPGGRRLGQRRARRVAAASRLVGAGSRALDQGDRGSGRQAQALARQGACRRQGHRPVRPDAWRDADRRRATRCCGPASCGTTRRSHAEAAQLDANPIFRPLTGNIVFPGFTAPKLLWVKNNEPKIFEQVRKVLLPKDYLRLWLTGEYISEMSDSAGTAWLDVGAARLVAGAACRDLPRRAADAVAGRRHGARRHAARRARRPMGHGRKRGRGRRRRRQRGLGLRHGHGQARRGLRVARHVRRAVCRQRRLSAQSRRAPCTRSAMRCPMPGTRWASSCRRRIR